MSIEDSSGSSTEGGLEFNRDESGGVIMCIRRLNELASRADLTIEQQTMVAAGLNQALTGEKLIGDSPFIGFACLVENCDARFQIVSVDGEKKVESVETDEATYSIEDCIQ
jgi:hypothetical protein